MTLEDWLAIPFAIVASVALLAAVSTWTDAKHSMWVHRRRRGAVISVALVLIAIWLLGGAVWLWLQ